MKKSNELDINYYVNLAAEKVGFIGDLYFQGRNVNKAGTFEILEFTPLENPHFYADYWQDTRDDIPTGAHVGIYTIRLSDTKFYNGKIIRFKVTAYVQTRRKGLTDDLYIWNINEDTGKMLRAYEFPIIH